MSTRNSNTSSSSRISGFYRLPLADRQRLVGQTGLLSHEALSWLRQGGGLEVGIADKMSENVIACQGLPLGVALNFRINQHDYLVPMAVEEPSVIAAASNAARLVRIGGGFQGEADPAIMTAQVQFDGVVNGEAARERVMANTARLLSLGNAAIPSMTARGGGCQSIEARVLPDPARNDTLVVVHIYIDVGNAMGANIVDTVAEALAPTLHELVGGRLGLRILTNVPMRRRVRVTANVSAEALGGDTLTDAIARASRFAELDPLRAATHNKGVMNGIDAVAIALGQDWRAIEAGAHAYAALSGTYRPLSVWQRSSRGLLGTIELPMAVGTVGASTRINPGTRAAFELLNVTNASQLGIVMAAAGLASNLAALRALGGEGIQKGHMRLHRRRQQLRQLPDSAEVTK